MAERGVNQAETGEDRWWAQLVHRKGHIGPVTLTVLTLVACLPLLLAFARIIALPSGEALSHLAILQPLRSLGEGLNQTFTLDWVPSHDRGKILYLLLLPTGAMLVALARLTFGIRVMGLRAILIAIGFQASGLVPSLTLMAAVITMIVVIRPWIRQIKLPLYARIAVILSLSSAVMIGALLLAPWLRSEAVWGVAFFPVIIMAMLAEGVAKTLEKDNLVTAIWRTGWTLILALLIAGIDSAAALFTYQFPELMLTQLVSIVFISEFFDLRLLEEWPERLSRYFAGVRPWYDSRPKVALVRNRDTTGVIGRLGRPAPAKYAKSKVQRHADALRAQGFQVKVMEGDVGLLNELKRYLPPHPRRGVPGGIVLNLATGIQGTGRLAQVPAMLELAGVPYTGPDPAGHALLGDRVAMLTLLGQAEVTVPRQVEIADPSGSWELEYPVAVRPRYEPDARRSVVRNRRSLRAAVQEILREYGQPAVAEEVVRGREIRVGVIGNELLECLPLLEYVGSGKPKECPAVIDENDAAEIRACARAAYRAVGCRDYARIDIRITEFGTPVVVDINWADLFARRGSFVVAAEAAGYDFGLLLRRIISEAARRYVPSAGAQGKAARRGSVVSLEEHRAAAG